MEEFPLVTIFLSTLILATFIFTTNVGERIFNPKAESRLSYYQELLGFIPARPKIYSLITYTFLHADIFHLLGNLTVLIIVGLALEKHIGKIPFLSIYISSGCTAATFDIINRFLLKISLQVPFIGASGSIFGLIAVASLTRPLEKIPTFLILLSFIPFFQLLLFLPIFSEPLTSYGLLFFILPFISIFLLLLPKHLPMFIATILFITSWILFLALNLSIASSQVGHLGGFLGGLTSLFLFPKTKH